LDPQLVVGFDTRADGAKEEEVDSVVEETWSNYPVVIFSQVMFKKTLLDRRRGAYQTRVAVLSNWEGPENSDHNLAPMPVMWELDAGGARVPEPTRNQAYLNSTGGVIGGGKKKKGRYIV